MSKFTDGPWIANDKHSGGYIWRVESDANGYPNDGYIIAKLDGPDAEANARLIAVAPELLAEIEAIIDGFASTEYSHVFDDARALIARAKGDEK